jgi:hypothetical protein
MQFVDFTQPYRKFGSWLFVKKLRLTELDRAARK